MSVLEGQVEEYSRGLTALGDQSSVCCFHFKNEIYTFDTIPTLYLYT